MTNKSPVSKDWRNLPIEKWNTNTVHAFLIDMTKEKYNAIYVPGGGGPVSRRWVSEKGMIKRELDRKGPAVVKKFIEICWREYYTPNPKKFPYPTYGFMAGYMAHFWTEALQESEHEEEVTEAINESHAKMEELGGDSDWF